MAMKPDVREELLRRAAWTWYLWAVVGGGAVALSAYLAFRQGIIGILSDPFYFFMLFISLILSLIHI